MSLVTLPRHNYTYLAVETEGSKFTWSTTPRNNCSAQFWIDKELDEKVYEIALPWKFWKPIKVVEVFAYGQDIESFYDIIKLQRK